MVFPFGNLASPTEMPQMFLNSLRRELVQAVLGERARLAAPMVEKSAYLQPYCTEDEGRLYVYLVNASLDPARGWTLRLGGGAWTRASLRFSDGRREELAMAPDGAGRLSFPQTLPPMETVLITLEKQTEDME